MTDVYVISVVLNDKAGLERTAESVLGQAGVTPHWVIADGGSTDGSSSLAAHLQEVHAHVTLLRGPDSGIYHGMNRALEVVPDEALVWFLNAGDFFLSEHSVAVAVERTPTKGWSGGPMVLLGESGVIHDITAVPSLASLHGRPGIHLPAQPSILMAKSLYLDVGPFREDLRFASDGVLYQNLAKRVLPAVHREPLVGFTLGGRSSKHFRKTLMEFWGAGYRPRGWATRIVDRDAGQARTWMRGMKLKLSSTDRRWSKAAMGSGLPFQHWGGHPDEGYELRCCLTMGRPLASIEGESG